VLTYRLEPGAKPGDPIKVTVVEPPAPPAGKPALVVQCGKGGGKQQDEVVSPGFAYQLLQGTPLDGWPASAGKPHCWYDANAVRFAVTVPPGTAAPSLLPLLARP